MIGHAMKLRNSLGGRLSVESPGAAIAAVEISSSAECVLQHRVRFALKLEHAHEIYEIDALLLVEPHVEATVVEVDDGPQVLRGAAREVRSAGCEPAQLPHDDRSHVVALAGDQRTARIMRVDDAAQKRVRAGLGFTHDAKEWQLWRR